VASNGTSCRRSDDPVRIELLGTVDYLTAWDRQRETAEARRTDAGPDVLMLLEHPSVYTAGRRTRPADRPTDGSPVIDVDRGGAITWHGPGQLVGYPIIGLAAPLDVVDYVRRLEEALIAVCADLGLPAAGRVEGRSGVWLPADDRPERKLGQIGVRVQGRVTLHGLSLNCSLDLEGFGRIVPCGIADAGVSTLSAELGREVTVAEVIPAVGEAVLAALDGTLPVREHPVRRPAPDSGVAGLDLHLHAALR